MVFIHVITFFPLTDKRVGDLNFPLLLKKAFTRRNLYKTDIVISIPRTEPSAKYRGVRYFGISLHHNNFHINFCHCVYHFCEKFNEKIKSITHFININRTLVVIFMI
jgi:hypothetical protein